MYIGLNSGTIQNRVDWPEFAHLAHRAGYGGVDMNLGKTLEDGVDSTRALLKELNLQPAALPFPVEFRKDEAAFREGLKALPRAAEFGAAIGCPRMVTWIMSSSRLPRAEQKKIYLERFRAAAAVLAKSGVRLGLEFLGPLHIRKSEPNEFIYRMDEMLEFAVEIAPNVGLLVDSWHWHHAGGTPEDIVEAGQQRVVHVHLADAAKLPPEQVKDGERLIPGDGVVNWKGFLGALQQIGYAGGCSIEVFGAGLKEKTPEEAARVALAGAQKVMREAGIKA